MDLTAHEISELVEGCMRQDKLAQKKLYTNFYKYAMHVCLPYTNNEADAEDILSNAFVRIFKNITQYDATKGSLFAWVRRIVVNASLDFIKQQSRFSAATLEYADEVIIENNVLETMSANELLKLIRTLPPATQAVFNLYCIEGFNHREIAEMLHIKEGTSKWHVSEAKMLLKKSILKLELL